MTDVDIRDLRDTATRRARQQLEQLDLGNRARHQLEQMDIARYLPKNATVDWDFIHEREERAASRGFLAGVALGALVGAVLALVFAPRRGAETRETIAEAAGDLKEKATEFVGHAREQASEPGANVSDFQSKLEEKVSDAADSTKDMLSDASDQAEEETGRGAESNGDSDQTNTGM
ncbi:MAG: YtxH domain-containing protein [Thermomicrobiales bacterium]